MPFLLLWFIFGIILLILDTFPTILANIMFACVFSLIIRLLMVVTSRMDSTDLDEQSLFSKIFLGEDIESNNSDTDSKNGAHNIWRK